MVLLAFRLEGDIRAYKVIDDNGEIVEEGSRVAVLNPGDRVLRKASIDRFKRENKGVVKCVVEDRDKDKTFIPVSRLANEFGCYNLEELGLVVEELDVYQKAFLISIIPWISYGECAIKKRNGYALKIKDLVKITGISKRKLYDVISELKDKHIIVEKCKVYHINPWLFYKGNKINRELKDIFGEYKIHSLGLIKWNNK